MAIERYKQFLINTEHVQLPTCHSIPVQYMEHNHADAWQCMQGLTRADGSKT